MDNTTEFLKGALLGYASIHTPEDLGNLFSDVFKYKPTIMFFQYRLI